QTNALIDATLSGAAAASSVRSPQASGSSTSQQAVETGISPDVQGYGTPEIYHKWRIEGARRMPGCSAAAQQVVRCAWPVPGRRPLIGAAGRAPPHTGRGGGAEGLVDVYICLGDCCLYACVASV
ncbi:unnamed protein product, partial [Prorocentrum cordatum]